MQNRYRIYRAGVMSEERDTVSDFWNDSEMRGECAQKTEVKSAMVGFLLGCSFSWEQALVDAGLTPRHIEEGRNVPMCVSTQTFRPCGVKAHQSQISLSSPTSFPNFSSRSSSL
jgi:uncharacterized protein YcsI (UPF0317 family)